MNAFVFPGQGSQKRGMGSELFDAVTEFRDIEKDVDQFVGYSLRELCVKDPQNRLKETRYTQPCLYAVNALHYYRERRASISPSFAAGHSLGEYNALLAAGAFDFMTGLRLVKKRGEIMAKAKGGGMAAVVGLQPERIVRILEQHGFTGIDVANYNSPTQSVIAGPVLELQRAEPHFCEADLFMTLPVSAAFHSRYMRSAAAEFADYLQPFKFSATAFPVIANLTGQPYPEGDDSEEMKSLLVGQICGSVRWTQSIIYLRQLGITRFKELGPGVVLTRLIEQIATAAAGGQRKDELQQERINA